MYGHYLLSQRLTSCTVRIRRAPNHYDPARTGRELPPEASNLPSRAKKAPARYGDIDDQDDYCTCATQASRPALNSYIMPDGSPAISLIGKHVAMSATCCISAELIC